MDFILVKFFLPLPFMENISDLLLKELRALFNLVTLPLTFDNSIPLHHPSWPSSSPSSSSIFFVPKSLLTFYQKFLQPNLIFDALSIEIPPKLLFHLCISHFRHLYELLLHLVSHHFFFEIFFFIIKTIIFFICNFWSSIDWDDFWASSRSL